MSQENFPPRRPGRPKKPGALTPAQRSQLYRDRKKERLTEIRDVNKPLRSALIDLSALPPWKRRE